MLGVLIAAISGTLATKRQPARRASRSRRLLIAETHEEILAEEFLSILFQLEVFEGIPGDRSDFRGGAEPGVHAPGGQHGPAGVSGTLAEGQRQGPIDRAGARARCRRPCRDRVGPVPWGVLALLQECYGVAAFGVAFAGDRLWLVPLVYELTGLPVLPRASLIAIRPFHTERHGRPNGAVRVRSLL